VTKTPNAVNRGNWIHTANTVAYWLMIVALAAALVLTAIFVPSIHEFLMLVWSVPQAAVQFIWNAIGSTVKWIFG
jgi:uncharacterized integral membrane protein